MLVSDDTAMLALSIYGLSVLKIAILTKGGYPMRFLVLMLILIGVYTPLASAATEKPNILVVWGDDIGWNNPSAYHRGLMGYKTPNIDRIANEGALFTDWYGGQSCTAGRAAFITGQSPFRTGLLKVGLPGAKEGLSEKDPTIAGLLKNHGYMTGQFGKNHLGDLDEHLPTNHGFDEFQGNLYHLNAEEEPELPDYPKNPEFRKKYGLNVLSVWRRDAAISTGLGDLPLELQPWEPDYALATYTDAGQIGALFLFGRMDGRLDGLSQGIRFADYGVSGFFDVVKINEPELEAIYQFDLSLVEDIEAAVADAGVTPLAPARWHRTLGDLFVNTFRGNF